MNDNFFLKSVFSEIIRGYSFLSSQNFYIKHANSLDSFELEEIYKTNYDLAISRDLSTNEKQLKYLSDNDLWIEKDEQSIKDKKLYIHGLKTNKSKSLLSREQEYFTEEIKKTEKELNELELTKQNFLGMTCEIFASKKCNEFSIYKSLYKNKQLTKLAFTEEEYSEIEDNQLYELIKQYNDFTARFNEKNIKKVAVSPFFLNLFYLCDNNPYTFYGKPVINLTYYQADLFHNGCYFKNILSEMKDKLSPEILNDPDKLITFYETDKNIGDIQKSMTPKGEGGASAVVGASKEDREKYGQNLGIDMAAELKKSGKEKLSLKDIIKTHGL